MFDYGISDHDISEYVVPARGMYVQKYHIFNVLLRHARLRQGRLHFVRHEHVQPWYVRLQQNGKDNKTTTPALLLYGACDLVHHIITVSWPLHNCFKTVSQQLHIPSVDRN